MAGLKTQTKDRAHEPVFLTATKPCPNHNGLEPKWLEPSMSSEPRSDAKAAMPSKTTKERRLTQIAADYESKNASGTRHMERKDWIEGMK